MAVGLTRSRGRRCALRENAERRRGTSAGLAWAVLHWSVGRFRFGEKLEEFSHGVVLQRLAAEWLCRDDGVVDAPFVAVVVVALDVAGAAEVAED